jgi:hypothetical protein
MSYVLFVKRIYQTLNELCSIILLRKEAAGSVGGEMFKKVESEIGEGAEESAAALAQLYSLKEVDTSSIRRVGQPKPQPSPRVAPPPPIPQEPQLPLPFPHWGNRALVADGYLLPWMGERGGVASELELKERLEAVPGGLDGFEKLLVGADRGVWAVNRETIARYQKVIARIRSYFYRPRLRYPLEELIGYLEKEFAREWSDLDRIFIRRCLDLSPDFRVRKREGGEKWVAPN